MHRIASSSGTQSGATKLSCETCIYSAGVVESESGLSGSGRGACGEDGKMSLAAWSDLERDWRYVCSIWRRVDASSSSLNLAWRMAARQASASRPAGSVRRMQKRLTGESDACSWALQQESVGLACDSDVLKVDLVLTYRSARARFVQYQQYIVEQPDSLVAVEWAC